MTLPLVEVEFRRTPDDGDVPEPWRRGGTFERDAAILVDGLDEGDVYDFRIRQVATNGQASDWITQARLEILDENPPREVPAPTGVHVTDDGCLTWELPDPDYPARGFRLRHAPPDEDAGTRGEPLHDGDVAHPPFSPCRLPGGQRAVFVQTVGSNGQLSAATRVLVHLRELDDAEEYTLRTEAQEPFWPSALQQGGVVVGPELHADIAASDPAWMDDLEPAYSIDPDVPAWGEDGTPAWSPLLGGAARAWPRDETLDPWGVRYGWIEYVWAVQVSSCEAAGPLRLTVEVDVESPNGPWRIQYRRPGSSAQAWDPDEKAAAWGDDADPAWAGGNERWEPWAGHLDHADAGEHRFRVLVPGGLEQGKILSAVARLSAPGRTELHELVAVPLEGGRVAPATTFRMLREVETQTWSATPAGVRVDLVDKDRTRGPQLIATDKDGNPSTALVDVFMRGF